jgi:hypothetical protein
MTIVNSQRREKKDKTKTVFADTIWGKDAKEIEEKLNKWQLI